MNDMMIYVNQWSIGKRTIEKWFTEKSKHFDVVEFDIWFIWFWELNEMNKIENLF